MSTPRATRTSSPERAKRLALTAAILGSFVAGLDASVVNVALPSIRTDLGGGLAAQQWIANAYLLTLGSLILVGGSLGDVFGERRIFAIGVGGFGVVSLLCALAPSVGVLVAGRTLQGVFGALLTPSALAVIVSVFPPKERGAAVGTWTAWSGISFVIGPLVGGWLIDALSWRWIFGINVPFVAVTLALVFAAIPARPSSGALHRVDWLGGLLTALGLAGPVLALIRQPAVGWGSPQVWATGLGGIVLLAAFVAHEARTPHPMLPLGLFARRNFSVANLQTLAMYGGLGTTFFLLTVFLQQVAGYDALLAGVATIPTTIVMFALSSYAGRLADRLGPRLFLGLGPLVAAAGLALMQRVGAHVDYFTDLFPALLVFSLGLSATVAPLTATVLADADEHNAGIASGVNNAIARVANLLCVAAIGAVVAAHTASALAGLQVHGAAAEQVAQARSAAFGRVDPKVAGPAAARAVEDASVGSFHLGVGIAAALVAAGGVLGLAGIRNRRRDVRSGDCAGGQLAGQPRDAARERAAIAG